MKDVAVQAVKEAGEVLVENFGRISQISVKEKGDLVTNADLEAEKRIVDLVRKNYPRHTILSEESKKLKGESEYRWIVDPLDGTHNYVRGIDIFGVSIALQYRGEVILGVVYIPLREQLYFAQKGEGSYLNGRRIRVSQTKLDDAYLVHDSDIRLDKGEVMLKNLGKLTHKTFNLRILGSSAVSLSFLAEGKVDIAIDYYDKSWDFSGGALIVEEAGGKVTDMQGKRWNPESIGYVASNGKIHDKILQIISE